MARYGAAGLPCQLEHSARRPAAAELNRYADAGVRAFLAAYARP
jgi:hypothetical protein